MLSEERAIFISCPQSQPEEGQGLTVSRKAFGQAILRKVRVKKKIKWGTC